MLPIRFDKALTHGLPKTYKFEQGGFASYKIPFRTAFIILGGVVHHVSGTGSRLSGYNGAISSENVIFTTIIASAKANGDYPLFNTEPDVSVSLQPPLLVFREGDTLQFIGAAGSHMNIRVLEWDY